MQKLGDVKFLKGLISDKTKTSEEKVIQEITVPLKSKLPPSRETRISSRETKLSSRETRLSSRETRLSSLETRLSSLETRVSSRESLIKL